MLDGTFIFSSASLGQITKTIDELRPATARLDQSLVSLVTTAVNFIEIVVSCPVGRQVSRSPVQLVESSLKRSLQYITATTGQ